MLEWLLSVACFLLGHFGPAWWQNSNMEWMDRIVPPYQETANGDVLIQLGLHHNVQEETVPVWMLLLITLVIPLLVLPTIAIRFGPRGDFHAISCVFGWSIGFNWLITDTVKAYCAQLRPNFYALCEFDQNKECASDSVKAYKSFPSGHSSLAFCSMTIVTLYWLGKVGGAHRSLRTKLLSLVAFFLPTGVAIWIAASRVHDYYHHPVDVMTGAVIGTMCGQFCTSLYYPSCAVAAASDRAGCPLQAAPQQHENSSSSSGQDIDDELSFSSTGRGMTVVANPIMT